MSRFPHDRNPSLYFILARNHWYRALFAHRTRVWFGCFFFFVFWPGNKDEISEYVPYYTFVMCTSSLYAYYSAGLFVQWNRNIFRLTGLQWSPSIQRSRRQNWILDKNKDQKKQKKGILVKRFCSTLRTVTRARREVDITTFTRAQISICPY